MNARLYDPALGRFLSPDPYVQAPDFSQSFNRYSYCLNNPLRYVDKNGEIVWFVPILIGVGVNALIEYGSQVVNSRSLLFLIYQYMNNITSKILAYICRIMYLYGIKLCK